MAVQLLRLTLYSIIAYLAGVSFSPAVAASQPTVEQEIHLCGGTGFALDEPHYDQSPYRRYARSFAANLNVGEPRTVRMIYFLPNDRPYREEVVQKMKDEMQKIQTFYAEQMNAHGYAHLTFRYETEAKGAPMVNRVDGDHPDSHYLNSTAPTAIMEIETAFDLNENIYLIVIDNSIEGIGAGGSEPVGGVGARQGKNGGYALVSDEFGFREAAHELGHAFGLQHDFSNWDYIMSYGWSPDRLSACHAEFLSVHPYFNRNASTFEGESPAIELISPPTYPEGSQSVSVRLQVNDTEGVQLVLLFVRTVFPHPAAGSLEVKACRGAGGEKDTVVEFEYDGVIPSNGLTDLSQPAIHSITLNAVDADGNVSHTTFTLAETSPHHITTFRNTAGSNAVAFSPNGKTVASGGNNKILQLWDVQTQEMIANFGPSIPGAWVNTVSFSPNGITLAAGGWDWAAVWDVVTGGIIASFRTPSTVNSVSISPNDTILAAGGSDGTVQVWNVATEQNIATLKHMDTVNAVAFSRDGNILASGSRDSTVKLWDVAIRQDIATLDGHTRAVTSVAFSPDGAILASGSGDGTVKLWDVATQRNIASLQGHSRWIASVAFSRFGTILASGASDRAVKLWDISTRVNFATLQHEAIVESVAFSSDGKILASGLHDGTVELWDAAALMEERHVALAEVDIPDENLRAVVGDAIGVPPSSPILRGQMASLVELKAWNASISDLTGLESATNLVALRLDGNNFSDVSALEGLRKLKYLYLSGNNFSEISAVAGLVNLANLPNLTDLGLGGNNISDISALAAFNNLTILRLGDNNISDISALAGLTKLQWLILKGNPLSNISAVSNLTNLTNLTLGNNLLLEISAVSDLINLRVLWANHNNIFDISAVARLTALTSLNLSDNNITDISSIAGKTNLDHLWLSGNDITDISALSGLTKLQWLWLDNNSIQNISSLVANSGLGEGDTVDLQVNPLNYESLNTHIPILKERGVRVYFINRLPPRIRIVSGNNQQGLPGAALERQFVVEVRNQSEKPIKGIRVRFNVKSGEGTLSATDVTTDSNGRAETILTLGPNPGTNTVTASVAGGLEPLTFNAEGIRIPRKIEILSGNDQQGRAGHALEKPFVVEVRDESNKPIQGVSVSFSISSGGGTLSATTVTTNNNGRAESTLTLGPNPGTNTVKVSATGSREQRTFTAEGIRIPKKIEIISGNDQQGRPGEALDEPFVVEVRDESNKPIQGVPVTFTVTAGGGTLSVTQTATDEIGRAKSTLTLGSEPGTNTVRVSVEGYAEAVATLFVEAVKTPMFTLSIPAGTHSIHIPLAANRINGEDGTIETVGDVYDALGDAVNFIISFIDGSPVSYLGDESAGSMADAEIEDDTGLIAVMNNPKTLELTGDALGTIGISEINIDIGNNLVGVPLHTEGLISDLLVEGVAAIAVSNAAGDGFNTISKYYLADDGPLMGGVGYVVVATEETSISIQGSAWENQDAVAAPAAVFDDSQTPVLYVEGGVIDKFDMLARIPELRVIVKNLSTGGSLDTVLGTETSAKTYSATFVELSRRAAKAGDVLNIAAHSLNPYVGVRPVPQIVVSAEAVLTSRIKLPDLELYEIPSETELLANYPNPFNPETWIPYRLANAAEVTLRIYDTNGSLVHTIDVGFKPAAVYETRASAIHWDGRNASGELVASGAYFYHFSAGDYSATRRMVILK